MKIRETQFSGLLIIEPKVFQDERGFFYEPYSFSKFQANHLNYNFVQDNHAKSVSVGVLRGLHFQIPPHSQTKLIRVTRGAVYDIVVDLRPSSHTFKKWFGIELSEENFLQLLIPSGFAHGYITLKQNTEFLYKVDNYYDPKSERGIIWNDKELNIDWKIKSPILSPRDTQLPSLESALDFFL